MSGSGTKRGCGAGAGIDKKRVVLLEACRVALEGVGGVLKGEGTVGGVVFMNTSTDPHTVSPPAIVAVDAFGNLVSGAFEEVQTAAAGLLDTVKKPEILVRSFAFAAGALAALISSVKLASVVSRRHASCGHITTSAVTMPIAEEQAYQEAKISGVIVATRARDGGGPLLDSEVDDMNMCMSALKTAFRCGKDAGHDLNREETQISDGAQVVVSVVLLKVMRCADDVRLSTAEDMLHARCVCSLTITYDPATSCDRYMRVEPMDAVVKHISW